MIATYQEFVSTLEKSEPSITWPVALKALWYDAKGDWDRSHDLVDQLTDINSKWVHAYLHRKEGDEWNAGYWYRQAGKPFPKITLAEESKMLISEFLH